MEQTPRIVDRVYRRPDGQSIILQFDRTTGEALFGSRWWDEKTLKYLGYYQQAPKAEQLPPQSSLKFKGAPPEKGVWPKISNRRRGKAVGRWI
ncbi:MAG: hypothetical protein AAGA46_00205 [Cyanobacteria bacterium P01_F01_bin.13]